MFNFEIIPGDNPKELFETWQNSFKLDPKE
jgi:hypothetical protein